METKDVVVAIVGATGLIGSEIQNVFNDKKINFKDIKLIASNNSKGEMYEINGESYEVQVLDDNSFNGVDVAFFALPKELAAKYINEAKQKGVICIDCVNSYEGDDSSVVIPSINFNDNKDKKVFKNPCAVSIALCPVLNLLNKQSKIKEIVYSSYEGVASFGKMALDELWDQTLSIFNQKDIEIDALPEQIAFNCIPHNGEILEDGASEGELRVLNEIKKVLNNKELKINGTRVHVPVFFSDGVSVNVKLEGEVSAKDFSDLLLKEKDINVYPETGSFPMQIDTAGDNDIHVGRIRNNIDDKKALNMWVVSDSIRRGSALNAIEIMQKIIENK